MRGGNQIRFDIIAVQFDQHTTASSHTNRPASCQGVPLNAALSMPPSPGTVRSPLARGTGADTTQRARRGGRCRRRMGRRYQRCVGATAGASAVAPPSGMNHTETTHLRGPTAPLLPTECAPLAPPAAAAPHPATAGPVVADQCAVPVQSRRVGWAACLRECPRPCARQRPRVASVSCSWHADRVIAIGD
jgi:hypothetical protein